MKLSRIFLFTVLVVCAFVDILCWTVPFAQINMLQGANVDKDIDLDLNNFVSAKYNTSTDKVDILWCNGLKLSSIPTTDERVYLGGQTLGFCYQSDGVLVVAKSSESVNEIESGDILKTINGKNISSVKMLMEELNQNTPQDALLKIVRGGKVIERVVKPSFDAYSKKYKLGIWAKDSMSGIGTLTFVRENGSFGALGHPIVEPSTNTPLGVANGSVYRCAILGVKKATRGNAGELRGMILQTNTPLGNISSNGEYGLSGKMDLSKMGGTQDRLVRLGGKATIHPGKAKVYSSIDGVNVLAYDIEIIKTNYSSAQAPQNFVFRVVDKELIEATGGIVQGMSGSPIVQDERLVGAVTHVFINDSTKGFGTYIENMLN